MTADERHTARHDALLVLIELRSNGFGIEIEVGFSEEGLRSAAHLARDRTVGQQKAALLVLHVDEIRQIIDERPQQIRFAHQLLCA